MYPDIEGACHVGYGGQDRGLRRQPPGNTGGADVAGSAHWGRTAGIICVCGSGEPACASRGTCRYRNVSGICLSAGDGALSRGGGKERPCDHADRSQDRIVRV